MELFTRGRSPWFLIGSKAMRPIGGGLSPELTVLSGKTVDKTGAAVAAATVELFKPTTNQLMGVTVSDGSGNFSFSVGPGQFWQLEGYLAGSPDLAGVTRVDVTLQTAGLKIYLRDPTTADSGGAGSGYSRARVANMAG